MRRPALLTIVASILAGIVLFVATLESNPSAQESTPGSLPATPTAELVWPLPDQQNAAGIELYVTKVTLPPGVPFDHPAEHRGSFVLTVTEGAICYHHTGLSDSSESTVIANVSTNESAPAGCDGARTDCEAKADCVLAPGEVVYLPAGSWVTQSDTASHQYGNVGDVTAVVYISGHWDDSDSQSTPGVVALRGCGGGCPRP
jgi:hypothetical protein